MHSIKILHSADMHLGSVFSGLPYDKASMRKNEAAYTCMNIIKMASDCDALLLPGDIFDSGDVSLSYADMFIDAVSSINPVPVFYACGNHDSYYSDIVSYILKNSPPNLHIFTPDAIECVTIEDKKLKVYGASFSKEHCESSMLLNFTPCDTDYINILCIHADVSPSLYNPVDTSKFSEFRIDYAALGHVHAYDGIKKSGDCFWGYPGIPEGRGFDECGTKGYIKGTVSKNAHKLNFYPACKRCYIDERLDISDFSNKYELIEVINSICLSPDNICRFTLIGENNLSSSLDTKFLEASSMAYHSICRDNTVASVSFEEYTGLSGLKGLCAKETQKLIAGSDQEDEKEKYKKAFKMLSELFENR